MPSPADEFLDDDQAEVEDWQLRTPELRQEMRESEQRQARHNADVGDRLAHSKIAAVMPEYHKARRAGLSVQEACAGLEAVLREVFRVHKFTTCEDCEGTGYEYVLCDHGRRCGHRRCSRAEDTYFHYYVVPCPCPAGDRFRRVSRPVDDITSAGKVKAAPRRRGFTSFGGGR